MIYDSLKRSFQGQLNYTVKTTFAWEQQTYLLRRNLRSHTNPLWADAESSLLGSDCCHHSRNYLVRTTSDWSYYDLLTTTRTTIACSWTAKVTTAKVVRLTGTENGRAKVAAMKPTGGAVQRQTAYTAALTCSCCYLWDDVTRHGGERAPTGCGVKSGCPTGWLRSGLWAMSDAIDADYHSAPGTAIVWPSFMIRRHQVPGHLDLQSISKLYFIRNFPLPSAGQHPTYGDCLEVKREYHQNCSVLDCMTQCSQSATH